jgi:phosphoribosylanthranilate isomerase
MRVKICGITNLEEARLALSCGADAVGFLIGLDYRTDDAIEPSAAKKIIASLPPFVSSVLVTHRTEPGWVVEMCQEIACSTVQLHGEFPPEKIPALREKAPHLRVIKAVHVVDTTSLSLAAEAARWADAILLDTKTDTRIGGTGLTHDWSISASIVKQTNRPVIMSGGLNPDNVRAAIATVLPYAVDVNSGVENPDGSKSPEKLRAFVRLAKEAGSGSRLDAEFLLSTA